MRWDNLSPAIFLPKYDFDAIREARALVRSGFQTETAGQEPSENGLARHVHVCVRRKILLRFRSLELVSSAKCAASGVLNSIALLEEVA